MSTEGKPVAKEKSKEDVNAASYTGLPAWVQTKKAMQKYYISRVSGESALHQEVAQYYTDSRSTRLLPPINPPLPMHCTGQRLQQEA